MTHHCAGRRTESQNELTSELTPEPAYLPVCRPGLSRWRGGRYRVVSREISGAADVVWVTEKGDSCDPFTQDDAGGTPAPQLFGDHNSQVLAVRNCVRSPLWQAARSARTQ